MRHLDKRRRTAGNDTVDSVLEVARVLASKGILDAHAVGYARGRLDVALASLDADPARVAAARVELERLRDGVETAA